VSGTAAPPARRGVRAAAGAWARFWERVEGPELDARWWHSHYLTARAMPPAIAPLAKRLRGRVLDVGAGTGYARRLLDATQTVYIPTDLPSGRDAADPTIARGGERPRVYCSGYQLPFADGSLGGVTALMVLEHVERPAQVLAEAYRVLAPGGQILVSVPFAFPVHGYPFDFRRWTARGIEEELKGAGFTPLETVQMGNTFSTLALILNFLGRYYLPERGRVAAALALAAAPLRLAGQAAANLAAVALGPLDISRALPLGVVALAEKADAAPPGESTLNATYP